MNPYFEVRDLSVRFGGIAAVEDVGFALDKGQFLGLIGPNGAGKTTVLNCISRVVKSSASLMQLDGQDLRRRRPHQVAHIGVSRTFQAVEHFKHFTVLEYVSLGRLRHYGHSVVGYGLALPRVVRRERTEVAKAESFLEKYGLGDVRDYRLVELPYGFQKLADIVRAIASEPMLLLLDEPAAGSSETERALLRSMVAELRTEGCTVILVDHDVAFVSGSSDRILAMDTGRKLTEGRPDEVLRNSDVIASYFGVNQSSGSE